MLNYKDFILEDISKDYNKSDTVSILCHFCGNTRFLKLGLLLTRLSTKWCADILTCGGKDCNKKKQQHINSYRAEKGLAPHQGYHVSKEQEAKRKQTMKERYPNGCQSHRKGKSHIEQYGAEEAERIRKINSETSKLQFKDGGPLKGKKHSEETKIKMRKAKKNFLESDRAKEKKVSSSKNRRVIKLV